MQPTIGAAADQLFQEATALHAQHRLVEAERLYQEALTVDRGHAASLCYLGLLNAQLGRLEDAVALLQQSIDRKPDAAEGHNHLGSVLQQLAQYDAAIAHHERALALVPNYAEARFNLAVALQAAGRHADAIAQLQKVVADQPGHAEAHFNLGELLRAANRPAEATAHFREAASLEPRLADRVAERLANGAGAGVGARPLDEQAAMQRMNAFIGSFLKNQDNPRMGLYPGLSVRPSHEAAHLPAVRALETAYDAIRREIAVLAEGDFHEESEGFMETAGWDVLVLYERGLKNVENCAKCPIITQIIESHATVRTLAGLMYVSKLRPGTHIKPHRGPTNMRLRCHLGIQIPEGDCGLRVGDQRLRWQQGRCILFDDHLEHEAWNHTSQDRIVLIIDLWHPDLTPTEIAFLEGLHRFGHYQAVSLNRYWAANAKARTKARTHYD